MGLTFRVYHQGLLGNIPACCECLCVCLCVRVAPIRGLSVELSRLSGYEEMKCTVSNVFPAPRVTWATEPPTFEDLRPVTRMLANKQGLYTADSRLKRLNGRPNLIYICKVTSSYGGPTWTASLRERGEKNPMQNISFICFNLYLLIYLLERLFMPHSLLRKISRAAQLISNT